jgi:hypothetical protein
LYEALTEIFANTKTTSAIESMMAHTGSEPKKQAQTPKPPADDDEVPF